MVINLFGLDSGRVARRDIRILYQLASLHRGKPYVINAITVGTPYEPRARPARPLLHHNTAHTLHATYARYASARAQISSGLAKGGTISTVGPASGGGVAVIIGGLS